MSLIPLLLPPGWFHTCSLGKKSYPLNLAWPSCLQSTFFFFLEAGVFLLLVMAWFGSFLHSVIQLGTVYGLPFCDPNVIDHYMCDMYPLLKLSCTDTYVIGILVVASGGPICTIAFLLLLVSYGVILHSLKNLSQEGRRKALQTCGSHITVVVCFFVPCIFIYVRPAKTFDVDKSLSVFYTVITPMLNPLIYSLRNSELTNAMKKLWRRNIISHIK